MDQHALVAYLKKEFVAFVHNLLVRALLNRHQTPQVPGMSTVKCFKGINLRKLQLGSVW